MLLRLGRAALLGGLLLLPGPVRAADAPAVDEGQTLDLRRISPEQGRRLLAGETIDYQVPETSETELGAGGAGVGMSLPVPLARAAEVLTGADVVLKEPSITASGPVPPGATPDMLAGFKLGASELAEAQDVLEAAAGYRFNLAPSEIDAFR